MAFNVERITTSFASIVAVVVFLLNWASSKRNSQGVSNLNQPQAAHSQSDNENFIDFFCRIFTIKLHHMSNNSASIAAKDFNIISIFWFYYFTNSANIWKYLTSRAAQNFLAGHMRKPDIESKQSCVLSAIGWFYTFTVLGPVFNLFQHHTLFCQTIFTILKQYSL